MENKGVDKDELGNINKKKVGTAILILYYKEFKVKCNKNRIKNFFIVIIVYEKRYNVWGGGISYMCI